MKPPASFYCRHYLQRAGRRGQTLVEYALILAFIAIVAIAVLMATGGSVKSTFNTVNVQLSTAAQGAPGAAPGGRGGG
jgi:Flp pilus assembly pilin Flp